MNRSLIPMALLFSACTGTPIAGNPDSLPSPLAVTLHASSATSFERPGLLRLEAQPNAAVERVEFYRGGQSIAVDASAPYTLDVALTKTETATLEYTAKAVQAQQSATSTALRVNLAITGAVRFASATGKSSNDGLSVEKPQTLRRAAELTQPGDTVLLLEGEPYSDPFSTILPITRSGAPNAWIAFMPYPGHRPVLQTGVKNWGGVTITASYIILEGLEVAGHRDSLTLGEALQKQFSRNDPSTNTNCIYVDKVYNQIPEVRSHHVIIRGNTVYKCPGAGIATNKADYVTIEGNSVWGNMYYSIYGGSGISILSSYNFDDSIATKMIVRGNTVYDNKELVPWIDSSADPQKIVITDGNGIIIDTNNDPKVGPYKGRTLVENNVVYDNGARGIHVFQSDNVDVLNNTTFHNNTVLSDAEITAVYSRNVRVHNNIIVPRPDRAIIRRSSKPEATGERETQVFAANLSFGGLIGGGTAANLEPMANRVNVNPLFVDATNANFQLQSTSPAIDAGNSSLAAAFDMLGEKRPKGAGVDIGAFER